MPTQITTLDELVQAARDKRSVVCGYGAWNKDRKPSPAAFVACMSGSVIHRMLQGGMYLYEPPKKAGSPWGQR